MDTYISLYVISHIVSCICRCLYTCDCLIYIYAIFGVAVFVSFVSLRQQYLSETTQERFRLVVPWVSACHATECMT